MAQDITSRIAASLLIALFLGNDLIASTRALSQIQSIYTTTSEVSSPVSDARKVQKPVKSSTPAPEVRKTVKHSRKVPAPGTTFFAEELQAYLGQHPKDPTNMPADDIFSIAVQEEPGDYAYAYLQYSIKGHIPEEGIGSAVNGNEAYVTTEEIEATAWTQQRLAIDKRELFKGKNQVRFALEQQKAGIEIKDVQLMLAQQPIEETVGTLKENWEIAREEHFKVLEEEGVHQAYATNERNMPSIPNYITNVNKGQKGYKVRTAKARVRISIAIDERKITSKAAAVKDVVIFYFDETDKKWVQRMPEHFDMANGQVEGEVPGNSSYFAGMIKTPEMPEASAFAPTAISGLDAANPATGMTFIQPPSISQTGEANISYPLSLPAGRQGMTPQLSLNYSSDGGEGWLGKGWSIPIPQITIDSRWGVPDLSEDEQMETYLLNGKTLNIEGGIRPNRGSIYQDKLAPIAREDLDQDEDGKVRFFERTMSSYKEIERIGSDPTSYVWTVKLGDGTTYYYGTTNGTTVASSAVLQNVAGIRKWYLTKVEDKWGNTINYTYAVVSESTPTNALHTNGKYVQLQKIEYTGYGANAGDYSVEFVATKERKDARLNLTSGVKELDFLRLESILVKFQSTLVKTYKFNYAEGDFFKTLLTGVEEWRSGTEFYAHTFDYYEKNLTYGAAQTYNVYHNDKNLYRGVHGKLISAVAGISGVYSGSPISTTTTNMGGVGASFGLGIAPAIEAKKGIYGKDFTFSGRFSASWGDTHDNMSLMDVDGDGIPDVVYKEDNGLLFYPFRKPSNASPYLDAPRKIKNRTSLAHSEVSSINYGFDFVLPEDVFYYGQNWNKSTSKVNTYVTDYNADGFMDLVEKVDEDNSLITFGTPDAYGELKFISASKETYNPVIKHEEIVVPSGTDADVKDFEVVRVWIAPFAGTVSVSGSASLVGNAQGEAKAFVQYNNTIQGTPSVVNEQNSPNISHTGISVVKGGMLFFRIQADEDGQGDFFAWNPTVTYTSSTSSNYLDANGYDYQQSDYTDGFLLSAPAGATAFGDEQIKVTWPALSLSGFTDDVTFALNLTVYDRYTGNIHSATNRYSYTLPAGTSTSLSLSAFKDASNNSASSLGSFGTLSGTDVSDLIQISFEVSSTSNVHWQNIDWRPQVEVSTDACGEADKNMYPPVDYYTYNRMLSLCTPLDDSEVSGCDGFLLWPDLDLSTSDVLSAFDTEQYYSNCGIDIRKKSYFVVKSSSDDLLYKVGLELQNDGTFDWYYVEADGTFDTSPMTEIPYDLEASCEILGSGVVFYGFYSEDEAVAEMLETHLSSIDVYDASEEFVITSLSDYENFYHHNSEFQDQTLQWGQFAWSKPDASNNMLVSELYSAAKTVAENENNDYSEESSADTTDIGNLAGALNPENQKFFPMVAVRGEQNRTQLRTYILNSLPSLYYYKGLDRWAVMGSYMAAYSGSGQVAPGKFGEKESFPTISERTEVPSWAAYRAGGIPQKSSSYSKAKTFGTSAPLAGFKLTYGTSLTINNFDLYNNRNIRQFMDINGDGYPDVMDASSGMSIQLTHPTGGHRTGGFSTSVLLGVSASSNNSSSVSGYYINEKPDNGKLAKPSGSASATFGDNYSLGEWRDINGDGLPDYIDHYEYQVPYVRLNNGRTLMASIPFQLPSGVSTTPVPSSENNTFTLGSNGNFEPLSTSEEAAADAANNHASGGGFSFSAGVNLSTTGTDTERLLVDLNGDGLTDRIEMTGATPLIWINTGTAFEECTNCGSTTVPDIGESSNISLAASIAGTYSFPVATFTVAKLKMAISANGQLNHSISRTKSTFRDMNGDGVPDFVETNKEGDLIVYYAQVNRSNMLKSVTNPLGGSFTLDYELVGNKFGMKPVEVAIHNTSVDERMVWDMPNSKWVMSRLTINDGYDVTNDGEDEVRYAFRYDGGIKSRRDREFLGFTRIQTLQPLQVGSDWFEDLECIEGTERVYTSQVQEFFRPMENSPKAMIEAAYKKGLSHRVYQLYHRDFVNLTDPENCIIEGTIELLNRQHNAYEFRYVSTDPLASDFNTVIETTPDKWDVVDWNTVTETATIFPAVIATESLNIPVKDEPNKVHLVQNDISYDAYFNVVLYGSGVYDGPVTTGQQLVGTQTVTTLDVIQQQHEYDDFGSVAPFVTPSVMYKRPSAAFMHNIVLTDSIIDPQTGAKTLLYYTVQGANTYYSSITLPKLEYFIVPSNVAGYSDDTVFVPNWMTQLSCEYNLLAETQAIFFTNHRKITTYTTNIYEEDYNVTTYGDVIARMIYFAPAASNSYQTNMLEKHQVYLGSTIAANLKRKTVVSSIYANKAPGVIQQHYAPGNTDLGETELTYDTYGNVLTLKGPNNHDNDRLLTSFTYDATVHQFIEGVSNSYGDATCSAYDYATGLLQRTTDINGQATQYVYDDFYRPLEIWAPRELANTANGPTIRYAYYPFGYNTGTGEKSLEETIPVAVTYHNINNSNAPGTQPTSISCTWQTVPTSATMVTPLRTATFMDGLKRVIQVKKDASSNDGNHNYETAYHVSGLPKYDQLGRTQSVSIDWSTSTAGISPPDIEVLDVNIPVGVNAEYITYDELSRKTQISRPVGVGNTTYAYKWETGEAQNISGTTIEAFCVEMGQSFSQGTATGSVDVVQRSYTNALGQQITTAAETGSNVAFTYFRYNYLNELERVEDPLGQVTTYTYDKVGRVAQEVHPDRGTSNFTYDYAGNLIKLETPGTGTNGIVMEYDYNRLKKKIMPAGGSGVVNDVEYEYGSLAFGYNTAGRVKKIHQGNNFAQCFYRYDELGNMTYEQKRIQVPQAGVRVFQTDFSYDSFGRIKRMEYPDGEELVYTYNTTGDLIKMEVDPTLITIQSVVLNILYNGRGKMAEITYGNGTRTTFSYNNQAQQLTNVKLREAGSGTDNLLDKAITYNDIGHVSSIINTAPGAGGLGGAYTMKYEYDELNRLSSVGNNSGFKLGTVDEVEYAVQMTYNLAGGITQKLETIGNNTLTWDYTYDGTLEHQLETLKKNSTVQATYAYNTSGSLESVTPSGGSSLVQEDYCWDEEQRLGGAIVDGDYSHYLYDHNGERIMKSSLVHEEGGVNGQTSNGYYSLNPYTVYPNAYYVATHYEDDVLASKHYYMGAQRVSTALINYPFVLSEYDLNDYGGGPEPEEPVQGSVTDLNNTLTCLGLVENTDYKMDVLVQIPDANNRMTGTEYLEARGECSSSPDPDCYCKIDPYWAVYYGDETSCSSLQQWYWYHPDYLGSTEYVTDLSGKAYQYFFRSPWGKELVDQDALGRFNSRYKFNGKEQDAETGNYYYGARYYTAELGMWLSVDPLSHLSPNQTPYHFVSNNPVVRVDPDGLTDYEWDKQTGKLSVVEGTQDDGPDRVLRNRGKFLGISLGTDVTELEGKIENLDNSQMGLDNDGKVYRFQTYTLSNETDAEKLFDLYEFHSEVEISKDKMTVNGEMQYRFSTSSNYGSVNGDLEYYKTLIGKGNNIDMLEMEHLHPNSPVIPAGHVPSSGPSDGDMQHVIDARKLFNKQDIKFYVNRFGTRYQYNEKGKI